MQLTFVLIQFFTDELNKYLLNIVENMEVINKGIHRKCQQSFLKKFTAWSLIKGGELTYGWNRCFLVYIF